MEFLKVQIWILTGLSCFKAATACARNGKEHMLDPRQQEFQLFRPSLIWINIYIQRDAQILRQVRYKDSACNFQESFHHALGNKHLAV